MAVRGADRAAEIAAEVEIKKAEIPPQYSVEKKNLPDMGGMFVASVRAEAAPVVPAPAVETARDNAAPQTEAESIPAPAPDITEPLAAVTEPLGGEQPARQAFRPAQPVQAANAGRPVKEEAVDEVSAVNEKARDAERQTFFKQQAERGQDEMGIASKTGAMTLGSIGVDRSENEANAKKKKEEARLNQLLMLLDDLREIDAQIAANNEALDAIREIRELRARGEFDLNNREHLALLAQAGISQEEYERDADTALDQRERELNEENDRLQQDRDNKVEQAYEVARNEGASEQQLQQLEELMTSNYSSSHKQQEIQLQNNVDGIVIENTGLVDVDAADVRAFNTTEEEVEAFMQSFSRIQQIEDPAERMAAEKALVDSLSEEAEMIVSWEESTEHLFEDGYFDALQADGASSSGPAPGDDPQPGAGLGTLSR